MVGTSRDSSLYSLTTISRGMGIAAHRLRRGSIQTGGYVLSLLFVSQTLFVSNIA